MAYGFIYLFQGIAMLITLGWFTPNWDYDYVFYTSKKDLQERMNNDN